MAASIVAEPIGAPRPFLVSFPNSFEWLEKRLKAHVDHDFPCPHCGAPVPENARFCRECGADDDAGWGGDADTYDDYESGEEIDYDDFVQREFPDQAPPKKQNPLLIVVVILLLISMLLIAANG